MEVDWERTRGSPQTPEASREREPTYEGGGAETLRGNARSCTISRCSRMKGAQRGGEAAGAPSRWSDPRSHLPTSLHMLPKQDENENAHGRAPVPSRRRRRHTN